MKDFSDLLIAYAGFPPKKKTRMLKRVKKAFGKQQDLKGISLDDFLSFYQVGCFAELGLGKWSTSFIMCLRLGVINWTLHI